MVSSDKKIRMNDEFEGEDNYKTAQYIKSYMFIKGFSLGKDLRYTPIALSLAHSLHEGQYRNDKIPYIYHPLKVCSMLISYGIDDDITLASALLHDVLEDCEDKLPKKGDELEEAYHLDDEILKIVRILSKKSGLNDRELAVYFDKIRENPKAALIKLTDRLHNISTVYTFEYPKMRKYIVETAKYLIPMASYCKRYYPAYSNAFSILKSGIESMNNSMSVMLDKIEAMEREKLNA